MANEWLTEGEEIMDSWHVYIGGETPTAAKITGKLHVTNKNVHFEAGLSLKENAGIDISNRIQAFEKSDSHVTVPFAEISEVKITKKFLILKSLHILLKNGGELILHFGAMSPESAEKAISSRLNS
ncbi:MAG: hypothetical protein PHR77_03865 [Kiritimatiellae bacterium]|nr:hypothetical protein [Kiritimatiellia bacterium]MDD5523207.1 hypothetical protein [Kiritimatiellia bacterium]